MFFRIPFSSLGSWLQNVFLLIFPISKYYYILERFKKYFHFNVTSAVLYKNSFIPLQNNLSLNLSPTTPRYFIDVIILIVFIKPPLFSRSLHRIYRFLIVCWVKLTQILFSTIWLLKIQWFIFLIPDKFNYNKKIIINEERMEICLLCAT